VLCLAKGFGGIIFQRKSQAPPALTARTGLLTRVISNTRAAKTRAAAAVERSTPGGNTELPKKTLGNSATIEQWSQPTFYCSSELPRL
jgi:hypothetical protein